MSSPQAVAGKTQSTPTDAAPFNPVPGANAGSTAPASNPSPTPTTRPVDQSPTPVGQSPTNDANGAISIPGAFQQSPSQVPNNNTAPADSGDNVIQQPVVPPPSLYNQPANPDADLQATPPSSPTAPSASPMPNSAKQMMETPQETMANQPSSSRRSL